MEGDKQAPEYTVTTCKPSDLSEPELSACVAVIKGGEAVAVEATELSNAQLLAIARKGGKIVAVGAIKRVRTDYSSCIAIRSGFSFPAQNPELGYVAVSPDHWRKGLSGKLVGALLAVHQSGALFATTYDDRMKKTLAGAGFLQRGNEWMGRKHRLTLWIREPTRQCLSADEIQRLE